MNDLVVPALLLAFLSGFLIVIGRFCYKLVREVKSSITNGTPIVAEASPVYKKLQSIVAGAVRNIFIGACGFAILFFFFGKSSSQAKSAVQPLDFSIAKIGMDKDEFLETFCTKVTTQSNSEDRHLCEITGPLTEATKKTVAEVTFNDSKLAHLTMLIIMPSADDVTQLVTSQVGAPSNAKIFSTSEFERAKKSEDVYLTTWTAQQLRVHVAKLGLGSLELGYVKR